jgi:hypothetical protein
MINCGVLPHQPQQCCAVMRCESLRATSCQHSATVCHLKTKVSQFSHACRFPRSRLCSIRFDPIYFRFSLYSQLRVEPTTAFTSAFAFAFASFPFHFNIGHLGIGTGVARERMLC